MKRVVLPDGKKRGREERKQSSLKKFVVIGMWSLVLAKTFSLVHLALVTRHQCKTCDFFFVEGCSWFES